jgi:hypothetical protein
MHYESEIASAYDTPAPISQATLSDGTPDPAHIRQGHAGCAVSLRSQSAFPALQDRRRPPLLSSNMAAERHDGGHPSLWVYGCALFRKITGRQMSERVRPGVRKRTSRTCSVCASMWPLPTEAPVVAPQCDLRWRREQTPAEIRRLAKEG